MKQHSPIGQHYLPKTYLKKFSIDPENRALQSFIYYHFRNEFESGINIISIDSDKFKIDDFYTVDHLEEPYLFETTFSKVVEPIYNKIMLEIENEKDLTKACRGNIISWLFFNKFRNEANRDKIEKVTNFMLETRFSSDHGKTEFDKVKLEVERFVKLKSKEWQLKSFTDEKLMREFDKGMGTKHWIILKSKQGNVFLTSDDPGFSININMAIADSSSLRNNYSFDIHATNYFVLSPKYCLMISPYWQGSPRDSSIHNQIIDFKVTNDIHIDMINRCTIYTKHKYVISNKKDQIEKYLV